MITVVVSTVLVAVGGAALIAPAASAAPKEGHSHWNHATVVEIRDRISGSTKACNGAGFVGGLLVGGIPGGATAVGLGSLLCGPDSHLNDAIDEAYWRNCGIDVYITVGDTTWDSKMRLEPDCA